MTDSNTNRPARRRFTPVALLAGVAASAAIALSMTGTLSAFTAAITNSTNTAASGTLVMQEKSSDGTVTCTSTDATPVGNTITLNASTCSTINKYGGSTTLVPGASSTTTVKITNIGTVPATGFTLTPTACAQSNNGTVNGAATDFCKKVNFVLKQTIGAGAQTTVVTGNTLFALGTTPITLGAPINPGVTVSYDFTVTLDSSAGNTYQGLAAAQQFTWQFTS